MTTSRLATNVCFAGGFLLCGPDALTGTSARNPHDGMLGDFFFGVQTLATIGYGSVAPKSLAANLLVTVEALFGLMGFALATGLLFARFSRPDPRIAFSDK